MTMRHDMIKTTVRRIANRAGIATSAEPVLRPIQGAPAAANANRPESRGDILLALRTALSVVDVSIIHPAAATYVRGAAHTDGSAAAARDHAKRARYETDHPGGYAFKPFSVETYGRLGKPAMQLLNDLASAATAGGVRFKGDFVMHALREISVSLCRGNAVMFRRGLFVLANASGVNFIPGMDSPIAEVP
jgi:hypothetical protein